ncbi:MAG: hypothetical protein IT308_09590 [Anaerolineaceae bacterium]|nr:hypothetical protein [Anaerolineaceae bacterium]
MERNIHGHSPGWRQRNPAHSQIVELPDARERGLGGQDRHHLAPPLPGVGWGRGDIWWFSGTEGGDEP